MKLFTTIITLLFVLNSSLFSQDEMMKKVVNEIIENYEYENDISFKFVREYNSLSHGFRPFSTKRINIEGEFLFTKLKNELFIKSKNKFSRNVEYKFNTKYSKDLLFIQSPNIDEGKVSIKNKQEFANYFYESLLYTPLYAFSELYYSNKDDDFSRVVFTDSTLIFPRFNGDTISIILNEQNLIQDIVVKYNHELYGDVEKKYSYRAYDTTEHGRYYPQRISQSQLDYIENFVEISLNEVDFDKKSIDELIPNNYTLAETKEEEIIIEHIKYSDNIHFLEIEASDDRVLLVNFDEYLLIAEAPLNTENGQIIIDKAKALFPEKAIKYFVFGHHHPHYIGGIRAFVNEGSTILAHSSNDDYVEFIVNAKHEIDEDVLSKSNKKLDLKLIDSSLVIGDENFKMNIIHIGAKSKHTADYLIYYFPSEKLLFQDDLVWIKNDGSKNSASDRQKGLYQAIKFNKLDVETIIQSWPVRDYGVKTIIPFKELEESIK